VQPKVVSDRMGHANMSVTFQIYGHRSTGRGWDVPAMVDPLTANLVGGLIHNEAARTEPS